MTAHPNSMEIPSFRIFISYSHSDERFREALDKHLSPLLLLGRVEAWHDRHIQAGGRLYEKIKENIENAHIILMLISADYLYSKACQGEMTIAFNKSDNGSAVAIPIVVRDCHWKILPIGKLLAANQDGKSINSQPDPDVAWTQVASKIGEIVNDWETQRLRSSDTHEGAAAVPESPAAEDEQSLKPASQGTPGERWVNRREDNDLEWGEVKRTLVDALIAQASSENTLDVALDVRSWGEKTIVDFTLPRHRNSRRLIIRDIGGYVGYPGYQFEAYAPDERVAFQYKRLRWLVSSDGARLLRQTIPAVQDMTVQEYAEMIWNEIVAMARV